MEGERFDAVVVGAGAAGLAAAIALAQAAVSTCLVGPEPDVADGRTAALLDRSVRFLDGLGLGEKLRAISAPLRRMRIIDDTGSLFHPPPVVFRSDEIGLDCFGLNVENVALVRLLANAARAEPRLVWQRSLASGLSGDDGVALQDGNTLRGELIVAADGRRSQIRADAGIGTWERSYPQAAFTTQVTHERDHGSSSTEFHTRCGPFTLVPMVGERRSGLVWVTSRPHAQRLAALDDATLTDAIETQARRFLGRMRLAGPRGVVPLGMLGARRMWAGRVALVSEAAHAIPPIGAQGLNLGLADVAALVDVMMEARNSGEDIGNAASLARYEARRSADISRRSFAVDGLNRALLTDLPPVDAMRGLGLGLLGRIGPLRRAVMRVGLMADGREPLSGRTGSSELHPFPGAG